MRYSVKNHPHPVPPPKGEGTLFLKVARMAIYWSCTLVAAIASVATPAAELRIGLSADVTTMDPHFVAAQPNLTVQMHVFDGLVRIDERGRIIPGVAASWSTPDPLTWEIKLRRDVKFHDG